MVATSRRAWRTAVAALLLAGAGAAEGAVLPEDRADVLYHYYSGDNVEIDGPSVLVRKKVANNFSVSGNFYVDTVSSASIDVVTTASPYGEERRESGFGVDYLRGDTLISVGAATSEENDYSASTLNFGIAQEIFGGLTTISLGYGRGSDEVRRNGDDLFRADVDRRAYRLGLSQVLTRNLLVGLNFELITDEGFLNNPYRSVRFADPGAGLGYSYQAERYPNTRTSSAVAVRGRYFLPWRAALHLGYRYFEDDWEIGAHTAELGYVQPRGAFNFELRYRYYSQTAADFYSDLFPFQDAQNFLARDKELATFTSHGLRAGVSYTFLGSRWGFLERGTLNAFYDHILFDYEDFRDLRVQGLAPGTEPMFNFGADVLQVFLSFWF